MMRVRTPPTTFYEDFEMNAEAKPVEATVANTQIYFFNVSMLFAIVSAQSAPTWRCFHGHPLGRSESHFRQTGFLGAGERDTASGCVSAQARGSVLEWGNDLLFEGELGDFLERGFGGKVSSSGLVAVRRPKQKKTHTHKPKRTTDNSERGLK